MPFGRSLLQREILLRVSGEERSPEILISFHSSGSTSNQWRKLKNPWFPGRTPFRPSCCKTGKKKRFFAKLAHSVGPTCILYLAEEALDRLEFLLSWDSMDQDLLSLYGQYRSTLVDHMDVLRFPLLWTHRNMIRDGKRKNFFSDGLSLVKPKMPQDKVQMLGRGHEK